MADLSGTNQLAQMLQGGAQGSGGQAPLQGPSQANQPTGFPKPFDPAKKYADAVCSALKKLAQIYDKLGDPQLGNRIKQMEVELDREQLKRDQALDKRMKDYSQGVGQPSISPTAPM